MASFVKLHPEIVSFHHKVENYQELGSKVVWWTINKTGSYRIKLVSPKLHRELRSFESLLQAVDHKLQQTSAPSEELLKRIRKTNDFYEKIRPTYSAIYCLYKQASQGKENEGETITPNYFDNAAPEYFGNLETLMKKIKKIAKLLSVKSTTN